MPIPTQLPLDAAARQALCALRDHSPKAYLRERAAVLLAIAAGRSIRAAAQTAGLKPHRGETVCQWVARYRRDGLAGLTIHTGRGRKPASFPVARRPSARAGARGGGPAARVVRGERQLPDALVARWRAPGD